MEDCIFVKHSCPPEVDWSSPGSADRLIGFIVAHSLLHAECPAAPEEGIVVVWSQSAREQLSAFLADVQRHAAPPVVWHSEQPPVGTDIVWAGDTIYGQAKVDAFSGPMPRILRWCHAAEARRALGLEP